MSANQTELRTRRYHALLAWFGQQQELAPINTVHHTILWQIYQFLVRNVDIWGTPDVQALCVIGDALVALYDRPLDVVDLTREDGGDGDGEIGGGNEGGNGQGDDSGITE
jgi:hypothetical protein